MTLLVILIKAKSIQMYTYAYFDVSEICKSLKSWSAITLNLNKKTKWVNGVMEQRVLPLLNLQYWSYDNLFTKNRYSWISHANLPIWWWKASKVSSRSVFVFACHSKILNNNYSWIFLCYFSNNKKNLLMIFWLYL